MLTPNIASTCFNQAIFYPWWQLTETWNKIRGDTQFPPKHSFTYETGSKENFNPVLARNIVKGIIAYLNNKKIP